MTFIDSGIFGFDISTYQDASTTPQVVDFQKMKDYGASFVIIRAGQGNFIDQDWQTHWKNSKGILPRGAYWFYDPRHEPVYQAELCASAIGSDTPEGRVWLDLEFNWSGSYSNWKYWKTWIEKMKSIGFRVGIYTGWGWWDANAVKKGADLSYFGELESWVAQYNDVLDLIPKGLREPKVWQDGTPSIGKKAGVESEEIDHDRWNKNYDFNEEWGGLPVPPTPGGTMFFKVVSVSSNIRSSAGVTVPDNDLGDGNEFNLITNDIVETDDIPVTVSGVTWRRLRRWWRGNVERVLPASPTGECWGAEKGSAVWFISTIFTPPPAPSSDYMIHYAADGTVIKKYVPE